jgi:3-carboxy-cis,cis-muconate cycloisomerase
MSISISDSSVFGTQFNHPGILEVFSDQSYLRLMVDVEVALAHVLGELGIIPEDAAEGISKLSSGFDIDLDRLRRGTERSGVPVIELVNQLREQLDPPADRYLHWGVTTQDIMDTARVLQIRECLKIIETDLDRLIAKFAELAEKHRDVLMPGRTHSQQALPITFGYKVSAWLAPLIRHRQRLEQMRPRVLALQFGGAAGTLAAYGDRGSEISVKLAKVLELSLPSMPWHTQRDGIGEVASWLSLLSGSLAKIAQDVILLAQSEIGEVQESAARDVGGSSTMPQKHNPIQSELILAAGRANVALLSAVHNGMIQEHERGTHGWQLEWIVLPQMFALTGSALAKTVELAEQMVINPQRMMENVKASHGTMMAEAFRLALTANMSPKDAESLVREACRTSLAEGRPLAEVIKETTDLELEWDRLADESQYLGIANRFIDRVIQEGEKVRENDSEGHI